MADEIKLKAPTVEQQVVVNINGEEKLRSFADTLEKISNNKNLQKYWKTQQELINATADAYGNFSKKASQDNAKELIKVTNALKAMSGTDLSNILPDFDKISKAMAEAQKVAGNIDSAFSVKGFKEAFDSFETLKAYGVDIQNLFSHFGVSSDVGELQKNVRSLEGEVEKLTRRLTNAKNVNEELRNEFDNFKSGSGFADKLDELDNLKSEMSYLREEAEETFRQFLKLNNVSEDGYDRDGFYDDNRFREYFQNIQSGYMSASDAIRQFKTEYSYLLEESFKTNNDTFGLEQLQAFSNKLDSIFRQVEETSTKINDIISNGVITKSVENLSIDSSLSDSQRSLFGNLLQDEESLKSITALFQKLIEESNKTSKVDLFNDQQLQQVLSIFDKMEGHLSSLRSIISDVGDGEEFSPLLKMINNVQSSISELATSVKGIGLNMNIDVGSDSEMEAKVQSKIANALQAYQRLFDHIKMSSAGGQIITDKFFDFDINQYDTMMGKLQGYKKFIDNMRKEAKAQFNGQDVLYQDTEKSFWTQASSAAGQVTKVFNEMKAASGTNPLADMFGKTDLSEVISQLGLIVAKLEEISTTASSFKNVFDNGFNITASVEEIDKLTNRVKELEDELSKVKLNPANVDKSNISSGTQIKDVFQDDDKINTDASTTAIKEESQALEQVSTSAKDAATSKEKFANANKEVKASAESSSTSLNEEKKKFENVGDSAEETKKKLDDVVFKPNTEGFDEIVSKLDIAKDKIEEISKITKSSVWSESQGEYLESYNIKYKNGTSEIRGESSNKKGSNVLRSNEVAYDAKVAEQEAKAVKEVWDKNVKAIQDYMDAVTKLNNLNAKDKGTGKYASQITLQEKNVEELKEKALEARTAITSMINPHDVSLNTWRDYLDVMKKFDQASLGSAESVAKLEDALRKMDFSSLESAGTKFDSQFKNLSIKPDGDHQFLSWTNDLKELNAKIDEYNSKVKYLKENNIVDGEQVVEVKNLRDEIEQTINIMTKTPQTKRGWTDIGASKAAEKVANVLKQNTKMSKEARDAIRAYYNELRSGNPSQPIDEILVKVNQLVQKERELGRVGKSFGEIFKEKVIYGGAAQLAGMVGFYDVINVGREAFNVIKDLDSAYTEMRKVSDETTQSLKNFQSASFDVAKQVGVTALEIQNSAADFMRLGYSLEEASKLSEDANIYANVGDMDISEATEHMISSIQAWQSEFSSATEASTNIINRYNEIGNRFAITSADIGSAMERSAAALKAGGNDLNESIGIITAGNLIQQDADTTANAIKVLSLRLRGAKADLESMNEETDGLVESTSKMREQIQALTGVDIMIDDNTFKSTAKIIQEIGAEWSNLSDVSQAATLELLAGKTRASTVAGLIENYQTIGEVIEAAEESENSARIENEKYLDSMEGRLNLMTSQLQEMASVSLNDNLLKEGISALTKILELITDIVDTFGLLPTAAGIGGIVASFKNVGINTLVAY